MSQQQLQNAKLGTPHVKVPTKKVNGEDWAMLSFFGSEHTFCGEKFTEKKEKFSFAGNHRVRLYVIKHSVNWRVPAPAKIELDITNVQSAPPVRRIPRV